MQLLDFRCFKMVRISLSKRLLLLPACLAAANMLNLSQSLFGSLKPFPIINDRPLSRLSNLYLYFLNVSIFLSISFVSAPCLLLKLLRLLSAFTVFSLNSFLKSLPPWTSSVRFISKLCSASNCFSSSSKALSNSAV